MTSAASGLLAGRDNTVYCYNGILWSRKSANNAILQKSIDGGANWTDVYTFTYNVGIIIVTLDGTILVSQKSDSSFFTDPPAQIYRSTDGGTSFTSVLTLTAGGFESFSYDVHENTVFVGEYGKYNALHVYKSTDAGANWTTSFTHPVDGSATVHIHKVHIDKVTPTTIYVSAGDNALAEGVWVSYNNGSTWTAITRSHQPTWLETDGDYLYLGEDLEGKIHRIAKSRFAEGDDALEQVYSAQDDPRGTFGNLSFYSGATDEYGNIYFGGVAYGIASTQNNNRDACLVVSKDQGRSWAIISIYGKQTGSTSSGAAVMSKVSPDGIIYVRTSNPTTVRTLDTANVTAQLSVPTPRSSAVRKSLTPNLVFNGDFSLVPPVLTAGTNATLKWIDGTAAGSSAQAAYGWAVPSGGYAGTAEAAFDPNVKYSGSHSMRLSNLNATGAISVSSFRNVAAKELIALAPNTQYRLTFRMKTNNSVTNGAYLDFRQYNAALSTLATTSSTKLSGTNDWTEVTMLVTTQATTVFGGIILRANAAGNVSDVWFDDIVLKTVTEVARQTV